MKESICRANCAACPSKEACLGCTETNGCPFGKQCYIAKYILTGDRESYKAFLNKLISEINALKIDGMESVTELYPLVGSFVNLEYAFPNGKKVKLLCDDEVYLGAQVKNLFDAEGKNCFGIIARENFLLVCEYGENGINPEIVIYKRR